MMHTIAGPDPVFARGCARCRSLYAALLSAAVSLAVLGCAATPALIAVTNTAQRLDFTGASVQPPQGDNWYTASRLRGPPGALAAFYKKRGEWDPEHSAIATLRLVALGDQRFETADELGQFMDRTFRADHARSTRFQLIASTFAVDASFDAVCVRLHQLQEDRGVPGRIGQRFIVDAHAIRCVHPESSGHLVEIAFSERRRAGLASWWESGLAAEVEPYFRSLEFRALN